MRILYNKNTKHSLRGLYILFGCACILFYFGYVVKPQNHSHPSRYSELECEPYQHSCRITNLYYMNNQFRIYLNPTTVNKTWVLNDVEMYLGIGFQSLYIRPWHEASMGPWPFHNEFYNSSGSKTSDPFIPLFVHFDSPPPYTRKLNVYTKPIVVYSILWPNLFRTIYAGKSFNFMKENDKMKKGTGAILSLMRYRMYFPEHCQMVLLDKQPHPSQFIQVLKASDASVIWWNELKQGIYKGAVLGISRDISVKELALENYYEYRFGSRNIAIKMFSNRIKSKLLLENSKSKSLICTKFKMNNPLSWPKVLMITRSETGSRRILNQDEFIGNLSKLPIQLSVQSFPTLSLAEQICLVNEADIMIGMHGAALAHVLFMKPGKTLLELFPFAFRKSIYQNLAHIKGIEYLSWQNTKRSDSKPRLELVESNRFTNMSLERIQRLPIDW